MKKRTLLMLLLLMGLYHQKSYADTNYTVLDSDDYIAALSVANEQYKTITIDSSFQGWNVIQPTSTDFWPDLSKSHYQTVVNGDLRLYVHTSYEYGYDCRAFYPGNNMEPAWIINGSLYPDLNVDNNATSSTEHTSGITNNTLSMAYGGGIYIRQDMMGAILVASLKSISAIGVELSERYSGEDHPETFILSIAGKMGAEINVINSNAVTITSQGYKPIAVGIAAAGGLFGDYVVENNQYKPKSPLVITGTIAAKTVTGDYAIGVMASQGPLYLDVTGNAVISATDMNDNVRAAKKGYAILSVGFTKDKMFMQSDQITNYEQNYSDFHKYYYNQGVFELGYDDVTLSQNARLIGKVDLGWNDDKFTLKGLSDVREVPQLNGGNSLMSVDPADQIYQPYQDTLIFDDWSGVLSNNQVINWEIINVINQSDVDLGTNYILQATGDLTQDAYDTLRQYMNEEDITLPYSLQMMIDETSRVKAGSGRYTITGSLTNKGMLSLLDNATDDRVTLLKQTYYNPAYSDGGGRYTGVNGSTLVLDVSLGGGDQVDPEILDLLQVGADGGTTGSVTGTTTLLIHNTSPGGAINATSNTGGILVVKVNGTSTDDAFSITSALNNFGTATVELKKGSEIGKTGADAQSWYLVITREGSGEGYVPPAEVIPEPTNPPTDTSPSPEVIPVVVIPTPETLGVVQASATAVPVLGLESMPRFHERQAYGWSAPGQRREPGSWWSRTTGSRIMGEQKSGGERIREEGYRSTLQAGSDLSACGCGQTMYRTGVFAGTGYLTSDIRSSGIDKGSMDVYSVGGGLYASAEHRERWYAEGVVQANTYDIDLKFGDGTSSSAKTWSLGASVEGGLFLKAGEHLVLEPQAQVMWQRIDGYRVTMEPASRAEVKTQSGLTGRLGLTGTVLPKGWCVSPVFEVNAVRDFGPSPEVNYEEIGQSYRVSRDRTWLGGSIGVVSRNRRPECLEYYAKVGMMSGVDGYSGRDYTITAGIRKSW